MALPIIHKGETWQGSNFTFLDRLVNAAGTPLEEDDVTAWSLRAWESGSARDGKKLVTDESSEGYVFDDLFLTHGWQRDTVGWNFKYELPYGNFKQEGGREVRFEFKFQTTGDGDIYSVWLVKYRGVLSR